MTPTENEAVEERLGKKEVGPEQEAKGGGKSEAGTVGIPMEIKEKHHEDEEKRQGDEEQASKQGTEEETDDMEGLLYQKEEQGAAQETEHKRQPTQAEEIMNPLAYMEEIDEDAFEEMDDVALEEFKNGILSSYVYHVYPDMGPELVQSLAKMNLLKMSKLVLTEGAMKSTQKR